MEHIKLFKTEQERVTFLNSTDYIEPHVDLVEDTGVVTYNVQKFKINLGDYYYSDGTCSSELDTNKAPIGICVIPYNFVPDGHARVMSLKNMCVKTPEQGSTNDESIAWGQYGVDTKLPNLDQVAYGGTHNTALSTVVGLKGNAYLPSDRTDWASNLSYSGDTSTHYLYSDSDGHAIDPYLTTGGTLEFNTEYIKTDSPSSSANCFSDLNGVSNTDVLCSLHTGQADWETASAITNNSSQGYSPAAVCCRRYAPSENTKGKWYLPAMGELGFIMPRFNFINEKLSKLGTSVAVQLSSGDNYWSSSEYDSDNARRLLTYNGRVDYHYKDYNYLVRAFLLV